MLVPFQLPYLMILNCFSTVYSLSYTLKSLIGTTISSDCLSVLERAISHLSGTRAKWSMIICTTCTLERSPTRICHLPRPPQVTTSCMPSNTPNNLTLECYRMKNPKRYSSHFIFNLFSRARDGILSETILMEEGSTLNHVEDLPPPLSMATKA